ncbi:NAD(P)-dependent oxidoreductase [Desulfovibrio cuneatus]|uniref:NAD(P)-dependent oxidoreductase n=1 Tax=Desulfovibrio cuneatus TaxID=159728 RepID=UPI0003FBC42E|nr:NAD(P)-dependent oxidoreductase [Desulfovibrio cuneatus]
MKFAFIGLGKMGGGLCKTLLKNGGDVKVYDIVPATVANFVGMGGKAARSAHEAALDVDAVFTSLPLPQDLERLLLGEAGILAVMKKGAALIDVSTIDPACARKIAQEVEERGLEFLACPLGKGPAQANTGEAPIFVGGRKDVFEKYRETLQKMGTPVTYIGDIEQSTAFKLITNLIGMTNVQVMAEGVKLAQQMGIDPQVFMSACKDTGAMSYQFTVRAPWIFSNDFAPRFAVNLALKDVRLGVGMAEQAGVQCPCFSEALRLYTQAADKGLGNEDCVAVYKLMK